MKNYFSMFREVLDSEASAILEAKNNIKEESITQVIGIFEILNQTGGNLIFSGVGKSGIIARKMASTFCSLGLPSFFLHPIEALHGDLGRVTKNDAIVLISKSGTTEELLKLLPFLPLPKSMMIGMLGNINSTLAEYCSVILDCSVSKEACPNNQAPTTSTTVALSVGDGLAVIYEGLVELDKEGFAINHPGGLLGKTLRLKVKDLMVPFEKCAKLPLNVTLKEVLLEMTKFPLGICAIIDQGQMLAGIIVEGDIRRTLNESQTGLQTSVKEIMNSRPVSVRESDFAYVALNLMEMREREISVLPVVDGQTFLGVIRLHDLLKEGFSTTKDFKSSQKEGGPQK